MSDPIREWVFDRRGRTHSQRVYDWWSRHHLAYTAFVNTFLMGRSGAFRDRTVDALALESGDRVLDVGCGPGPNFGRLAEAIGPTGTIVGVDMSQGMVAEAAKRGATLDCETAVIRGDGARLPVNPEQFDAACATLSLSAMADVESVIDELHGVLRSGGRIAILDARPFQSVVFRWLNPLIESVSAYITNWYPDASIVPAVENRFQDVTIETFHGGSIFVLAGWKGTAG